MLSFFFAVFLNCSNNEFQVKKLISLFIRKRYKVYLTSDLHQTKRFKLNLNVRKYSTYFLKFLEAETSSIEKLIRIKKFIFWWLVETKVASYSSSNVLIINDENHYQNRFLLSVETGSFWSILKTKMFSLSI